ncbi:MAG: bifunctional glycosyltransferase family 2/GtrA family protein [Candidatus Staskawiczbacteria bacterium]|nr:bifunctional glycosyltransferase family 2/GtrA family protein [Candidatus Staskawiczbacteria bacterium]
MWLSVIIPAYNEEKRIKNTLLKVGDYLAKQNYDYEIMVVNDGSTDKTADIVEKTRSDIIGLKLINNKENRGKGFVVRQGLLNAKGEYRLFLDADNSTSIEEIEKFFPYVKQGYDIVIGSRDIVGAKIIKAQPLYRKVLGKIYSLISHAITGLRGIDDTQCGFKIFSSKSINDILPKCNVDGFSFDSEILIIGQRLGYKIKEVPIVWTNDPDTKVRFNGMVKSILDLVKIGWIPEFLRFAVVGLSGTIINFIIFYCFTEFLKVYYLLSAIFSFIFAMTNNFILNKFWTFKKPGVIFGQEFAQFSLVSVIALLLNLFLLYFLTEVMGVYYLISQVFAIIPSLIVNFLGNKFWTFKK